MRTKQHKNQLLMIVLVVGFFIGIIYENIATQRGVEGVRIFSTDYLKQYVQANIVAEKYLWYVGKIRLLVLVAILLLGYFKWKKLFVVSCAWMSGFYAGVLVVSAILRMGIKGILFCFVALLPHGVFYAMGYSMLFLYWYRYPEMRWNRTKVSFMMLMFLIGITTEVYVNPMLVKWMIQGL